MIYEMRTYELEIAQVPEFENRFAKKLPHRLEFSTLAGLWHTEIGTLNQVVHIWPYEDLNKRAEIRKKAVEAGSWPPDTSGVVLSMRSEVLIPAPFMKAPKEQNIGPLYELRAYTYPPGSMPRVLEAWGNSIAKREELSPLAGCWTSDIGDLNRLIHLWAYKSFEERINIRKQAVDTGIWPPKSGVLPLKQETKLLFAASCSPMQ